MDITDLQDKWKNDVVARSYLEAGGYKLNRATRCWEHPDVRNLDDMMPDDYSAALYLHVEWNYGLV